MQPRINVDASDLQDEQGRWLREACDAAIAWPVLEQTVKRKHLRGVLYVYNRANPLNTDKSGVILRGRVSEAQARTKARLRRRARKPMLVDWRFVMSHPREFVRATLWNARLVPRYWSMFSDAWRFRASKAGDPQ